METSEFKQRRLAVKFDNKKKVCRKSDICMFSYNLTCIQSADNSQESALLHQLREDRVTRDNFIEFLAVQEDPGQFLVNDFKFWLEDEQFKVYGYEKMLCHKVVLLKVLCKYNNNKAYNLEIGDTDILAQDYCEASISQLS